MGKTITIYFDDEALSYIEHYEGKGTLINNLVKEHFNDDEEVIRANLEKARNTYQQLDDRLQAKLNEKARLRNAQNAKKELNKAELQRKADIEEHKRKWRDGEITDEEYWAFFDNI